MHLIIFPIFIMEHMRLGVFERARLIAGAQPSSTWHFTAALFLFFHFGISGIFHFFLSTTQGRDESPGYFLAAGFDWRFIPHFGF